MAVSQETLLLEITLLVIGLLGILVIALHLRQERKRLEQELEFQQKQYEEAREERQKRQEWLHRETRSLAGVSKEIADKIAAQLKENISWAVDALERAKLKPRSQTLFGERLGHFREEKEHIADHFVPLLLERCKFYATKQKKRVYLLIDAGTTLYPFFERLGREAVGYHESKEDWIHKLVLVTNNLPGIEMLIETGRINPNNRYSDLAIKCKLLPGVPLPIYSGITGKETNEALQKLKKEAGKDAIFIGLVTGNWIRLRRSEPACPVPLARGEGHLGFKQAMIDNSDEIYVVTPLGKIFIKVSSDAVNDALGFSKNHPNPDKESYSEVNITDEKARFVKLVSTCRIPGRVLCTLSTKVCERLSVNENDMMQELFSKVEFAHDMPHVLFPFDNLPENWYLQIETEFPHPHTRREEFMKKFFFVSPTPKQ